GAARACKTATGSDHTWRGAMLGRGGCPAMDQSGEVKMQKRILTLAISAFILASGATATAQQEPMTQQQAQPQQQQERTPQGAQTPRHGVEDDLEDDSDITGWHHGRGWGRYGDWGRGDMGFGMMRRGWMMGPGGMHAGLMMRMLFALMD